MPETKSHKVLIAPLDWGLGHATRMIPLIRAFLTEGCIVELASDGQAYELLQHEFPALNIHRIPGYGIHYSKHQLLMLSLIYQAPAMFRGMRKEHKWLDTYCENYAPDIIISDDRFGMHHKSAYSVYVTHQINLIMPGYLKFLQPLVRFIHKKIIHKYDLCLIPDMEINGLTGILAHSKTQFNFPVRYLGVLSRFPISHKLSHVKIPDVLAVISGPEPQRTIFENRLIKLYENEEKSVWVVSGKPGTIEQTQYGSVKIFNHLPTETLYALMKKVPVLICRSGYSTLMDLFEIGRKAVIIPTPGQTEQVYLANVFSVKFGFKHIKQNEIFTTGQFQPEYCTHWDHPGYSKHSEKLKTLIYDLLQIKKG